MELVSPLLANTMVLLAIIAGLAGAAWWIIALYWVHSREKEAKLRFIKLPEGLQETISGIPWGLILFYIFIAVSLIGYVIYVCVEGVTY
ncbi:MAG: hypothetical protein IT210_07465 [Armatimonadetes bacterium]|nr:hypothetical protein [Armatimonadota bacterium]